MGIVLGWLLSQEAWGQLVPQLNLNFLPDPESVPMKVFPLAKSAGRGCSGGIVAGKENGYPKASWQGHTTLQTAQHWSVIP